ncbi:hypothetical protein [Sphingomonas panacisoli]|uniref:hypothetical protein n=1 Tax=Sphingomonas panacisoli TaxID=1813879 RepID=UPI001645B711|nr:hypothetical protein [Sphingomonas panacisoli]
MTDTTIDAPEVDEMSHDDVIALLRSQQNFALAIPAGIVAAIAGAVLWAVVVYVSGYALGLMAIAVGAMVGYAVRAAGKGVDQKFGILGAVCAALGWALGTLLADIAMLAKLENLSFAETIGRLGMDGSVSLFMAAADVMDILFLGIAMYEGYKFALRHRL